MPMDLAEAGARLFPHLAPQATATVAAKPDVQPATATAAAKVTADPATATADAQADFGAAARRMYPHLAVQDVAAAKVAELAGPKPADQVAKVAPPVAPPVAPYALKAPEGQTFDAMVIDSYAKVAQELRLPQDQAQKVLDQVVPVMKARTLA